MSVAGVHSPLPWGRGEEIRPAAIQNEARRLDRAAKDFEAVLIAQLLAPLFSSVATPAVAGGGKSEEFFKSLLQEAYARTMAEHGGFGLADDVKASLIGLQGVQGDRDDRH